MPSFFRKEKNLIPLVEPSTSNSSTRSKSLSVLSQSSLPSYRSDASTYLASCDCSSSFYRYKRGNSVGDVYSRGNAQPDQDRSRLFAAYNPQKRGSENDEYVGDSSSRSVNSTRNALMMAGQAEEAARGTLSKLGDQSESLANPERHFDMSKSHGQGAEDELKQLNHSIFRVPKFRIVTKRNGRERTMLDVRETQDRLGRAATYSPGGDEEYLLNNDPAGGAGKKGVSGGGNSKPWLPTDELHENLDEISDVAEMIEGFGLSMSQELDSQNRRIDNITSKTDGVDMKLANLNRRQKKLRFTCLIYHHSEVLD
ncbi:protein transporter SEC9 [Lentinula edodes]|nr:protein transporter SEC9 [Lentinula edodes]